jgi:hypothetical protein
MRKGPFLGLKQSLSLSLEMFFVIAAAEKGFNWLLLIARGIGEMLLLQQRPFLCFENSVLARSCFFLEFCPKQNLVYSIIAL